MHVQEKTSNLEIKAHCRDPLALRARAERLATQHLGVDEQLDTYFRVPRGRLKMRESSLSGGQLIPYLRPDQGAPKRSDYRVIAVPEAESLRALLAAILGVHRVVRKRREIFLFENVRIHLDEVEGLGRFVELEAVFDGTPGELAVQQRKVDFLMRELGIDPADLIDTSYEGLLAGADDAAR